MDAEEGGAPAWLFSFVDLAFLMLIAMTQLAGDVGAEAPDLGEMIVPVIGQEGAPGELTSEASRVWQLRIHPRATREADPFELISPGGDASVVQTDSEAASPGSPDGSSARVARGALARQLDELAARGAKKPLLIPHEDSRSQDLLDAVALLEEHWPSRRRALVARVLER
jgi:hypothetical protein